MMTNNPETPCEIIAVNWTECRDDLLSIRHKVFVEEQGVPPELEKDDQDSSSQHLLALLDGHPVGCARLLADGHFGRLAVLAQHRRSGIGQQIVKKIEMLAVESGFHRIDASAQCDALAFYFRAGFSSEMPIFDDAGIPHVAIHKALSGTPAKQHRSLCLGEDDHTHLLANPLEITGFLQSVLSQHPSRLDIMLTNPGQKLWNSEPMIESISRYLRSSHRHRLNLLIATDIGIVDQPLIKLLLRLSSRTDILLNPDASEDTWHFYRGAMPVGLLTSTAASTDTSSPTALRGSASDPSRARASANVFAELWRKGKKSLELRQMTL